MDKVKINNQVVLMRKHVKQAKVHAINKFVKQAKLLQNRKGSEAQVQKAKRKADRYLEEIILLKKMKPDYVSKLALSKAKNWKDVLAQKSSTLEDRCLSILANYESVQNEVEKFHSSNPNLVPQIPDLVKEWEEKSKLPKPPDFRKKKQNDIGGQKFFSNSVNFSHNKEILLRNKKQLNSAGADNVDLGGNEKMEDSLSIDDKNSEMEKIKTFHNEKKAKKKSSPYDIQNALTPAKKTKKIENNKCFEENSSDENVESSEENIESGEENVESGEENNETIDEEDSEMIDKNDNKMIDEDDSNVISDEYSKLIEEDSEIGENYSEADDSDCDNYIDNILDKTSKTKKQNNNSIKLKSFDNDNKIFVKTNKQQKLSNSQNSYKIEINSCGEVSDETSVIPQNLRKDISVQRSKFPSENKLKAIAMLNFDDFEGLDEIPIYQATDDGEDVEEEEKDSLQKISDPFFLRPGDLFSVSENKRIDDSRQKNGAFVPKPEDETKMNRFERRNGRPKMGSQKSENISRFQKRESSNFNLKRGCGKGSFPPKNQERFQNKWTAKFYSRDKKGFNEKEQNSFPDFRKQSFTQKSNKAPFTNEANNSFRGNNTHKKDNETSDKPLHPSWEAKRKQKELTQTSFQGKRMVFDE